MLQLAQATATLANNGIKNKPHLVIATQDAISQAKVPLPAQPPPRTWTSSRRTSRSCARPWSA